MNIFQKPKSLVTNGKVELNWSNYATKADLKNSTGVDTLDFAKKTDFAKLKSNAYKINVDKLKNVSDNLTNLRNKIDKLDVDKLVTVPVDFSKISDAVIDDVIKKDVYDVKIKNIDINDITWFY